MRVDPTQSRGTEPFLKLVDALARYVDEESTLRAAPLHLCGTMTHGRTSKEEFLELCKRLWPNADVYEGHTHVRLAPNKKHSEASAYVDLMNFSQAQKGLV